MDPLEGGPVTPNHLLLGRATGESPVGDFDVKLNITKRTQMIEEVVADWWKKWYVQVFHSLVPAYRWQQKIREIKTDDVVLMFDKNEVKGKYKLGVVDKVLPSRTDGVVRRAVVKYKNVKHNSVLNRTKFKYTERAVHDLVVIVPSDYNDDEVDEDLNSNEDK